MRLKVTKNENSTAVKEMDVNITGRSKFLVDLKKRKNPFFITTCVVRQGKSTDTL